MIQFKIVDLRSSRINYLFPLSRAYNKSKIEQILMTCKIQVNHSFPISIVVGMNTEERSLTVSEGIFH
jgi:hypothetical protein